MNLSKLLSSNIMDLPRDRTSDLSLLNQFNGMFSKYLKAIDNLDEKNAICKNAKAERIAIKNSCDKIKESVICYLEGLPHRAYKSLESALTMLDCHLIRLKAPHEKMEYLYRVRQVENLGKMNRCQIFHVPFDKRHLVGSQRYSISGLPSLYLGGSLMLCWEELDRPPFETLALAYFHSQSKLSVLDFGFRPTVVNELHRTENGGFFTEDWMTSYLVCWPLIAACSLRPLHSRKPFIPEYIVPQLLLQWIRTSEQKIDGLRYFLTKIDQDANAPYVAINYVFPVKKQADKGYCPELVKAFTLNSPVAWSMLRMIDIPAMSPQRTERRFHLTPDFPMRYDNTEFAQLENQLKQLPPGTVAAS